MRPFCIYYFQSFFFQYFIFSRHQSHSLETLFIHFHCCIIVHCIIILQLIQYIEYLNCIQFLANATNTLVNILTVSGWTCGYISIVYLQLCIEVDSLPLTHRSQNLSSVAFYQQLRVSHSKSVYSIGIIKFYN